MRRDEKIKRDEKDVSCGRAYEVARKAKKGKRARKNFGRVVSFVRVCFFRCVAAFAVAAAFSPLFFACAKTTEDTQGALRFALSREEITLKEGEEFVLMLIKTPADGKYTPVLWNSHDKNVAEVYGGRVYALAAGETYVAAQTAEYTLSCKVTVIAK